MKVKIGDKVYDSNIEPIMIILDQVDKGNITSMRIKDRKYCSFPEGFSRVEIVKFMEFKNE